MPSDLRILCLNDVYKPERFSMMKTLRSKHQGAGETKLVLPGDFLGGSTFAAAHKGESVLDILNHLNVDYFTLGNHEFDFGAQNVGELIDKSNFKWLGSNVRHADSKKLFKTVLDTDVFDVTILSNSESCSSNDKEQKEQSRESVRVGVFGVCTQFTPMLSDPGDDVIFEDAFEHSERCVRILKQQSCDLIVALTHLELENDKRVAEALDIDFIIGGHEHTPFYFTHCGTTIIKCGQNMDNLGILDISFERDSCGIVKASHLFELLPTEGTCRDKEVDEVIKKWRDRIREGQEDGDVLCAVGNSPLSTLTADLRCKETAFACMVADAIVHSYQEENCQLGIQNGGFIRQDMIYEACELLTRSKVVTEMPFPRIATLLHMKLEDIVTGLEQMIAGAPGAIGSFPHISGDWNITYDLSKSPLNRIQSVSYLDEVQDLNDKNTLSKCYLVAISDFYVDKGGDGVDIFTSQKVVSEHNRLISDCVVDYLGDCVDVLSGEPPGRFVCVCRD